MTSWLRGLIVAGVLLGACLTGLGLLAQWWPALDIVNNGLPYLATGAVLILGLAAVTLDWRLILPAALLAAVNVLLVIAALHGAAVEAAPGSQRFLRIATFNLWSGNDRMGEVAKFLAEIDADAVVLQEVTSEHGAVLRQALRSRYPFVLGETGLVILSKHPILAEGRIDRPGFPPWISLMLRWARLDVNGTTFELVGVHLARPFYPELQQQDIVALTEFVHEPDPAARRRRRFQHEPVDGEARRLHAEHGSSALQHISSHLAHAAWQFAPSAAGRDRQCVRLASIRGGGDGRRPAARLRSQAYRGRLGACRARRYRGEISVATARGFYRLPSSLKASR